MKVNGQRFVFIWFITAFFLTCTGPASASPFDLLPRWPLNNIGDPIPDSVIGLWRSKGDLCPSIQGQFSAFPSKGNKDPKALTDPQDIKNYKFDHDYICDDGDQTTYNGLLCASGDGVACQSIAESQDKSGRFYRSPHRRWMWANRCQDDKNPLDADPKNHPVVFNNQCANGFSPDMNLGVLLYTVKTRDLDRYRKWLRWLDGNATTTVLCKLDGNNKVIEGTCDHYEWPRVCIEDLGHLNPGEDPGFLKINGKYGGVCSLRPWDVLDFAAVNNAFSVAFPSRMNTWEITSRGMILVSKELLKGAVAATPVVGLPAAPIVAPVTEVPPLILMSSVEEAKFPVHLDAIRVLIRMMIRNPSLELNSLPDLPCPTDVPGLLGVAANDATDPLSIKVAAEIITKRAEWNPFYKLLADGPTPSVREAIFERCPPASDPIDKKDWAWEKDTHVRPDGTLDNDKRHSMGWECVFVGNLYNKMRVKKPIVDQLLTRIAACSDLVGVLLKQFSEGLQVAEAANALAQKTLDEAERDLVSAQDFVNKGYEEQKKAALNRINELTAQLNQLAQQQANLEKRVADLRNQAAALPDKVIINVTRQVCKLAPWPVNKICNDVTDRVEQINQAKVNLLNQVTSVEKQLADLKSKTIVDAHKQLADANALVAKLDTQLQAAHNGLQKNILQTAAKLARADFALKGHLLDEARKQVSAAQRANARLNNYKCVWKKEKQCDAA